MTPEQDAAPPPPAIPTPTIGAMEPALLIAVGVAEAAALAGLAMLGVPIIALAGLHVLALAALAGLLAFAGREERDTAIAMLALISGAVIGPAGPLGAGLLGLTSGKSRTPGPLIAEWYERIALSTAVDPEARQCDDVTVGRTLDLGDRPPRSFPTVMQSGNLIERQTVLGHIARHFHPDYLPTLRLALESPEPVLRVQAAAVAAHIGPGVRRRCADRLASTLPDAMREPAAALSLLGELDALSASGLLDEAERKAADAVRASLGDGILAAVTAGPIPLGDDAGIAEAFSRNATLERLLVERRRFADLRSHRAARDIRRRHPAARFHRLGRRPIAARPEAVA